MLGLVQNMFGLRRLLSPPTHPIGVDFGTDCVRIAQVRQSQGAFHLHAAACSEIPPDVRSDPDSHFAFFTRTASHLLAQGAFSGRQAVLGLPASVVHFQILMLPPMDENNLKDSVMREASRRLPFEPGQAVVRYTVAGQTGEKPGLHVIVMAADSRWVNKYIEAAREARLNVIGMNVQPLALLDCFARVSRRRSETESTRFYIDIGSSGTRAMIARGTRLLLARNIAIGGDHLTRTVAESLGIRFHDARMMRIKLGASPFAQGREVEASIGHSLDELAGELALCRRDHDAAFPDIPIERLIFVGGEARQRNLCKRISKYLGVPGQTGDSLRRMVWDRKIGIESSIDRRHPQPAWAAAIGLSIGPATGDE